MTVKEDLEARIRQANKEYWQENNPSISDSEYDRLKKQIDSAQIRCDMATCALCRAVGTPFTTWEHRRGIFCVVDEKFVGKIDNIIVPLDTTQPVCLIIKTLPDVTK